MRLIDADLALLIADREFSEEDVSKICWLLSHVETVHDADIRTKVIDEFVEKLINRLEDLVIDEFGINKYQFDMDRGEYSTYCSLSLLDIKEVAEQLKGGVSE